MGTISERRRIKPRNGTILPALIREDDRNFEYDTNFIKKDPLLQRHTRRKKRNLSPYLTNALGIVISLGILIRLVFITFTFNNFQARYSHSVAFIQQNSMLYNQTYTLATERKAPPDQTNWPYYEESPYSLTSVYNEHVVDCSITILVMEAKLSYPMYDYGPGQSIWFALESIGVFAPSNSCVVLMTTVCAMKEYLGPASVDDTTVQNEIIQGIYKQSLPLFRQFIESGRVRINFIDHTKYHLNSCTGFSTSNNALIHRYFWEDEFIEADSDLIMVFQAENSALCYPLILDTLKDYAFVGSVWPKRSNPFIPDSLEGPCREMPKSWHTWLRPQRKMKTNMLQKKTSTKDELDKFPFLPESYPDICKDNQPPVGGGGLSIRSRKWMIHAIETCPHVTYSGLDLESSEEFIPCKVYDSVAEDYYFATILHGINAPLPSPYICSLFAAEVFWPGEVAEMHPLSKEELTMSKGRPSITSIDGEMEMVIPNGVYNVWWYHPEEMLRSEVITDSCPFLPYLYKPLMNRYDEFIEQQESWIGIGS